MEYDCNSFVWFIITLITALVLLYRHKSSTKRLPPGPPGWPLFGNLFDIGSTPHKTLAGLKRKYGPVVWLRIGSVNTMVLLNAEAATELFKNHDLSFVNRSITEVMKSHGFHEGSIALAPYGPYWRVMKRIMTVELLVQKRMNETVSIRQKCIDDLLLWIEKEAKSERNSSGIHVAKFVFLASFNMVGNLILSRDLVDPQSTEGSQFFTAMMEVMGASGHPNIVDLFPWSWLKWLDPQGLRRKMDQDFGKTLKIISEFIQERKNCGKRKDFLEVLLESEVDGKDEPAKISDHDLNLIIVELFFAGTETTSSTIEWAMVELLSNPKSMMKVKAELAQVIGHGRKFEESDIDNLKYLQAVVKETLRLHPPVPLLVPRKAMQDTNFMGYQIPKGTQVFVNAWAIGRDQECWSDPYSFQPERFIGSKVEYKGQHFELIPFGAGRRICAGISLAHRMLHLLLGSLLLEFDWEIENDVSSGLTDTRERLGVTVRKVQPLKAIPKKCIIQRG